MFSSKLCVSPRVTIPLAAMLALASVAPFAASAQDAAQKDTQESVPAADPATFGSGSSGSETPDAATESAAVQSWGETGAAAAATAADDTPAYEPLPTIAVADTDPAEPVADVPEPTGAQQLDAIVVTAQKRVQSIQDVPVAVTVLNQRELESQNITDVADLARAVPAIELNGASGNYNSKMSIRGLSTESYSRTAEQAVSFVLDGVVLGKAPTTTLFDIERVEVLRGPQGTLFGKNASAGVISVTTNAPDPSAFAAATKVDFGSEYDYRLVQAAINVPLGDTAAVRFNAGQNFHSGFIHNNVRNEDSQQRAEGGRVRLMWEPTGNFTINLLADYEQQFVSEQIYILFDQYVNRDTQEPEPLPGCGGAYASRDNLISCNGDPTRADRQAYGGSMQLDLGLGDYDLTSITAYRRYYEDQTADVDGLPGSYFRNGNIYDNRVFTQELRVASPAYEDFNYVAGLYYFDQLIPNVLDQIIGADGIAGIPQGPLGLALCADFDICVNELVAVRNPNTYTADITSMAAFGEATWNALESLRLIAGARYTKDDVSMVTSSLGSVFVRQPGTDNVIVETPTVVVSPPLEGRETEKNLSWKLGLQYDFNDDAMGYFTASNGYKGPQIIFVPPLLLPSYNNGAIQNQHDAYIYVVRPELPRAYELGLKSKWFGGVLAANLALFHTTVKDYQSSQFNDNGEFVPINISEVVTKGVELDLFGALSENLLIKIGLLYNKATYPDGYLWPCTQVGPGCSGTTANDYEDIGGDQLAVAPVWKINVAPEYGHDLAFGLRGFISADAVYRSEMRYTPNHDTRTQVGERTIVGARAGIRGGNDHWELSVFGRNLTNEQNPSFLIAPYVVDELTSPSTDTAGHVLSTESFRYFGVSAAVRF